MIPGFCNLLFCCYQNFHPKRYVYIPYKRSFPWRNLEDIPVRRLIYSFTFLFLLFTIAAIVVPEAPWWYASWRVRREFDKNPNLSAHLTQYSNFVTELNQPITFVKYLRPFTSAADIIKSLDVWDELALLLNQQYPGSGLALDVTISATEQTLIIYDRLNRLSLLAQTSLNTKAVIESPTEEKLVRLRLEYEQMVNDLNILSVQLTDWIPHIETLESELGNLNTNLTSVSDDANQFTRTSASQLNAAIEPLYQQIGPFSDRLQQVNQGLPDDIHSMNVTIAAIAQAEQIDTRLQIAQLPLLTDWIAPYRTSVFAILGILLLLSIVLSRLKRS
jgi:hypothetical protein